MYPAGPATCDGSFFRDQDIVVVSGVHGRDKPRASKIIIEGALNNDKIHFAWNSAHLAGITGAAARRRAHDPLERVGLLRGLADDDQRAVVIVSDGARLREGANRVL